MNNRNLINLTMAGLILAFPMVVSAQAVYVTPTGNVGFGTNAPISQVDVIGADDAGSTSNTTALYVTNESVVNKGRVMLGLENYGPARFQINNAAVVGARWVFTVGSTSSFRISKADTPVVEFEVTTTGDVNARGTFNTLSDRNSKTGFKDLDANEILDKVVALPLSSWSYKHEPGINHIGPMAQDFYQAFELGNGNKSIAGVDASGVALAAIQGLYQKLEEKEERIQALEAKLEAQELIMARVQALEEVAVKMMLMQEKPGLKTAALTN